MDYSTLSGFIIDMVEAGCKKFDRYTVEPGTTAVELREQRNRLRDELDRQNRLIRDLEDRLDSNERATIRQFIEDTPGSTFADIVQHSVEHAPSRINRHLNDLDGDSIQYDSETERWYPIDDDSADGGSEHVDPGGKGSERGP